VGIVCDNARAELNSLQALTMLNPSRSRLIPTNCAFHLLHLLFNDVLDNAEEPLFTPFRESVQLAADVASFVRVRPRVSAFLKRIFREHSVFKEQRPCLPLQVNPRRFGSMFQCQVSRSSLSFLGQRKCVTGVMAVCLWSPVFDH
jgi:hypothetical protein